MNISKPFTFSLLWILGLFLFIPNVQSQGVFEYSVNPVNNLNFGTFSVGQIQGGTIIVGSDGSVPPPSGSIKLVPFGLPPSAGEFQIIVTKGKTTITFSESSNELIGPSNFKLVVDKLTFDKNPITIDKFNASTASPFNVKMGGTITIPPGAPLGIYSGTINIIFSYN